MVAVRVALLALALGIVPMSSHALTIKGTVVNGTTGERDLAVDVTIVDPSEGMEPVQTVRSSGGSFEATGLDASVSVFLVRVDFDGVAYTETVRPQGEAVVDVVVMIYESVQAWRDVRVSIPQTVARRHGGHVEIERIYEINNVTNPPRTIRGEAGFVLPIPEDRVELINLYVMTMGVPVDREPEETGTPGLYRVEYPIRPGITRVGVAFSVPYEDGSYTLTETHPYRLDELTVFNIDPDMKISATPAGFAEREAAHGMRALTADSLAQGMELAISFAGGSGRSVMEGATPAVAIVPNDAENASLALILLVPLALAAFAVVVVHGGASPLSRSETLRGWYRLLVKRLARLDDLNEAAAVPADVYHPRRAELKTQLASLMVRLRELEGESGEEESPTQTRAS